MLFWKKTFSKRFITRGKLSLQTNKLKVLDEVHNTICNHPLNL